MREPYVVYQSIKAAEDMFAAMEMIPDRVRFRQVEFIDNETAAVNLDTVSYTHLDVYKRQCNG